MSDTRNPLVSIWLASVVPSGAHSVPSCAPNTRTAMNAPNPSKTRCEEAKTKGVAPLALVTRLLDLFSAAEGPAKIRC